MFKDVLAGLRQRVEGAMAASLIRTIAAEREIGAMRECREEIERAFALACFDPSGRLTTETEPVGVRA